MGRELGEDAGDSFNSSVLTRPRPQEGNGQDKLSRTDKPRGPVISIEIHVNSVGKGELLNILNKR